MARRKTERNPFPTEYEEEVLSLLETFGRFGNTLALADYFGVSHIAVLAFLRTTRAKSAASKAFPSTRELLRKQFIQHSGATQEPALLDIGHLDSGDNLGHIFESLAPEIVSLLSKYERVLHDRKTTSHRQKKIGLRPRTDLHKDDGH